MELKKVVIQFAMYFVIAVSFLLANVFVNFKEAGQTAIDGSIGALVGFFFVWILIVGILFAGAFILLKKMNLLDDLFAKKDTVATSKFATGKDFKGITGNDGLPIGKTFQLSEGKSFEHVLLVGPTGSGKTTNYYIPALLTLPASASIVVTDPKGELFQKTARHALNQGKNVIIFSPFHSDTMSYNPLALARTTTEVRELAQILLANGNAAVEELTGTKAGGSEWTNMATPLLVAFLLFVRGLEAPENTIHKALELIIENDLETLKMLIEDTEPEAQAQMNIFLQSAESEKTASSIKTVLATGLQMFTDPMIQRITSFNEINPKMLRERPTNLYIMVPEHKSTYMAPLMSPFYTQLLQYLVEDGKGCAVHMLLDEFANIGIIPGISKTLATIRSRRVSLSLGIQSINQLKQKYNEEANSILDNLKTKAFLPGLSYDSAEYASKMVGFKEIETVSTSYAKKQDASHSVSKQKRELMTADEVRRLEDETILIIADNRNPIIDKQNRYYKNKKLIALTEDEMTVEEFMEDYMVKG